MPAIDEYRLLGDAKQARDQREKRQLVLRLGAQVECVRIQKVDKVFHTRNVHLVFNGLYVENI